MILRTTEKLSRFMQALRYLRPGTGSLCRGLIGVAAAATLFGQTPVATITTLSEGYANGCALGQGGVLYCADGSGVFSLTPPASPGGPWTDNRLFTFNPPVDGGANAVVIGSGGVLYSNTTFGGPENIGIVFSLTPPASPGGSWTENVLYNSGIGGLVIGHGGVFYGVWPGLDGIEGLNGTVLSLTPPVSPGNLWTENVLYSFAGGSDGIGPSMLVMGAGDVLYGITTYGGSNSLGTVFSVTPPESAGGAWTEKVIYAMPASSHNDGNPTGIALGSGGVIFGVTATGGAANYGTAFSLAPPATPGDPWTPSVIHEFPSGTGEDVYSPDDVMVAPNGMLIGAAASGGAGAGGVFLLTPPASPGGAWSEVAAHFPHNGSEGRIPSFAVLGRDVIYGSTVSGGSTDGGTVFSLVP